MKNYLENIIEGIYYDDLGIWKMPKLEKFSEKKTLFEYQRNALKNVTKVLNIYFEAENSKKDLFENYQNQGLDKKKFAVEKFETKTKKQNEQISKRFSFFQNHFETLGSYHEEFISGSNFINRACFWMATGSGKSLVLIKTIELLDYLQSQKLIPQKETMILLPREDLIEQFKKEVKDFNKGRDRKIELINLKNYDEDKNSFDFGGSIKIYYYRADLLRAERKENILDYKSYENNGNWYVFLDEAHRGRKEDSLMQDYVSVLSKNGFLFNFSATFTDSIDYVTTCYNFNLEKFINAGYGKNLYLSNSYFDFTKDKDDFSEREKQKQVLKSLITLAFVKKSKKKNVYHNPLLITLVNSINTDDSDLLLFFEKLEEIGSGKVNKELFQETKEEIIKDFKIYKEFVFGDEELDFDLKSIEKLEIEDIFKQIFNAKNYGKIEILEGEKGKEIVLKLETSEKPFALIKIGDAKKFQREKLGANYSLVSSFDNKKYFENINKSKDINLLLGSRSFYEGWDSNRPNVINMINIGRKDAKKFVLQGIGRGIRIEPVKGERKRLGKKHPDKNQLLETLFVFATDKGAVQAIVETVQEQQNKDEVEISLFENQKKPFDLLLPVYKEEEVRDKIAKFNISKDSLERFKSYFNGISKSVLSLKFGLLKKDLDIIVERIKNKDFFQIKEENIYSDMEVLLYKIIAHTTIKNKFVEGLREMQDEIVHFKHIKVSNFSSEEIKSFQEKIEKVKNFEEMNEDDVDRQFDDGEITRAEYKQKIKDIDKNTSEEKFKDLKIKKISEHYYLPLIYSENEKQEYIKHIIDVPSEVKFIKNLEKFIKENDSENEVENKWMFSKIDEGLDTFHIPYFYKKDNIYRKFFPDFIFWVKAGNDYKIVFVDPKGTSNADYQNKIDEFEKLFLENGKQKIFEYKNFKVSFDLKMIAKDVNAVGDKYEKYWLGDEDFSFVLRPGIVVV